MTIKITSVWLATPVDSFHSGEGGKKLFVRSEDGGYAYFTLV